jgi:hypothetical protein
LHPGHPLSSTCLLYLSNILGRTVVLFPHQASQACHIAAADCRGLNIMVVGYPQAG